MEKNKKEIFANVLNSAAKKSNKFELELSLTQINLNGGTQPRVKMNNNVIEEYAESISEGTVFPPITVFKDKHNIYWLADGFHRFYAYRKIGRKKIRVKVKIGEIRDAILFSVGANSDHGLRRTNEDKRKAVKTLLIDEEWQKMSTRELADKTAVSNAFISNLKNEMGIKTETIKGKDGKIYQNKIKYVPKIKYYRPKLNYELEKQVKLIVGVSHLKEEVLLNEAIEYIIKKYLHNVNN